MSCKYYCIDEILLEETPLVVRLNSDCAGIGFLDYPHNKTPNLPAQSKVFVPLWLAELFSRKGLVSASAPEFFGAHIRELLERGPTCFQAQPKHPEFFSLALRVSGSLLGDRSLFRAALLALTVRMQHVFETLLFAAIPPPEDAEQHLLQHQLTLSEGRLFVTLKALCEQARLWKTGRIAVLKLPDSSVFPRDLLLA